MELVLKVLEAAVSQVKWRLKPSSKRRFQTDILALCSRMRPCVMVDYGGKMPELRDYLCACIICCKKDSPVFKLLNVMIIDDMVYLIHVEELRDFVTSSLSMEISVLFADLEHDPPKMIMPKEKNNAADHLLSAQKLFLSYFQPDGVIHDYLQRHEISDAKASATEGGPPRSSDFIDLSCCLDESQVTIPTLNGWLLGYPVIYLFSKDHIEDAIYNLSTKSLHIYQIFVGRINASGKGYMKEELLSFTVPFEVSVEGEDEAWAKSFFEHMRAKWEKCKDLWSSLDMEVGHCYPQAIAL